MSKPYQVMFHHRHPDTVPEGESIDVWVSLDFGTLKEAEAAYNAEIIDHYYKFCTPYIELIGPDVEKIRKNPDYRPDDKSDWRREQQMQSAMAHGTTGWNDYEGYAEPF